MQDKQSELVERFYRYVSVPSQSSPNGGAKIPSSDGQWDMAKLLERECAAMGLVNLSISDKCVLTGKLQANLPEGYDRKVP